MISNRKTGDRVEQAVFLLLIALSLALDAFAVSVSSGVAVPGFGPAQALKLGVWFGAFQFAMPLAGWLLGTGVSAYVEAAHDLLKKRLKRIYGNSLYLSEPFGPGYYGIPVEGTRGLFRLLDASRLGMELNESGMMLPEKSCSGFFVLTRRPAPLPKDCCESCLSPHSCGYCRKYEGQEIGKTQQ